MSQPSKNAFITGGSAGLGLATAQALAAEGFTLGLFARNLARLKLAREEIVGDFPSCSVEIYPGDVCDAGVLIQSIKEFATKHSGLEAVVHAAGQMHALGPIGAVQPIVWQEDVATTLMGAGHLAHAAAPWLEQAPGGGAMVAFVGPGHHQGLGFGSGYSAAQAGLVRLMENLALERAWPKTAGPGPAGFVGYYALYPAVNPTGVMNYVLSESDGRKWLPRFTEMFGEGKEVDPHVPAGMAAWLCLRRPVELSGRVVSGMLDPELTEMRLAILGEGEKGQLRLKF